MRGCAGLVASEAAGTAEEGPSDRLVGKCCRPAKRQLRPHAHITHVHDQVVVFACTSGAWATFGEFMRHISLMFRGNSHAGM